MSIIKRTINLIKQKFIIKKELQYKLNALYKETNKKTQNIVDSLV